jgi:hypothetical protein
MSSHVPWDLESFQESLPGPLHGRLTQLIATGAELPPCDSDELRLDLIKVLVRLRLDRLKEHNTQVKFLIDEATQAGGERDDTRHLYARSNQILRDLAHYQTTYSRLSRLLSSRQRAEQGLLIR